MTVSRRLLAICAVIVMMTGEASVPFPISAARGTQQAPKVLNLWFAWQMPEDVLPELAKWDVVVLDMDQQVRYPERIRRLRQLNPTIKILAYVDASNIATARFSEESHFPGYVLAQQISESWYVHRADGARASIWPGSWMLNVTSQSPTDNQGRRWSDALPQFIQEQMWSTGLWDGIFLDNAIDNATWFAGKNLDITGDGRAESDAAVDAAWKAGWQRMARNLRTRLGSKALIMGNGSVAFAGDLNGVLFENFPRYGWANGFRDYLNAIKQNDDPTVSALNGNTDNANRPNDWQLMRFTLATALLGDGYYSFDEGDRNHGQTWWYDEYDAALGKASGPAERLQPSGGTDVREGVWWRAYERGAVVVNSTSKSSVVELPAVFERLRGVQDPGTNNGRLETSLTLGPKEGLLLYRRTSAASVSKTTAYRNGDFVRVYRPDGTQARAGFFVQRDDVSGGATVLVTDLDRDGTQDVIVGSSGAIRMTYGNGRSRTIRPFGTAYRGGISLAAGNTDRDAAQELVAGSDAAQVKVLEQDGTVRATWNPYPSFHGSVTVAIGDLDGNGMREIVTGAGPGGGPHVRIFKTDGAVWGGSWFAFDAAERGGVFVTTGDSNGDGRDEVIAGSGQGSVPRVGIFNAVGQRQREFALSAQPGSLGTRVSMSDMDDDGTPEILASGIRPY